MPTMTETRPMISSEVADLTDVSSAVGASRIAVDEIVVEEVH